MWVYFRHAFYKNRSSAFSERRNSFAHGHRREQIVNELACGEGGRVHGAKCLAPSSQESWSRLRRLPWCTCVSASVCVRAPVQCPKKEN